MGDVYSGFGYGYSGNLHVKCWHCGAEKDFFAKRELETYYCNSCGKKTDISSMTSCFLNCECGNHARYYTNMKVPFDIVCFDCGQPVAMFPRKKKGKKMAFFSAYTLELQEEKAKKGR